MKLNARKFASWLIALVLVTLLFDFAIDGEEALAGGVGIVIVVVALMFRESIFRLFHHHIDKTLEALPAKLAADSGDDRPTFDVDAAFANYLSGRETAEPTVEDPETSVPSVAARARGFGRKGL